MTSEKVACIEAVSPSPTWIGDLLWRYSQVATAEGGRVFSSAFSLFTNWKEGQLPMTLLTPDSWPSLKSFGISELAFLGANEIFPTGLFRKKHASEDLYQFNDEDGWVFARRQPAIHEGVLLYKSGAYGLQLTSIIINYNGQPPGAFLTPCLSHFQFNYPETKGVHDLSWAELELAGGAHLTDIPLAWFSETYQLPEGPAMIRATQARAVVLGIGSLGPPSDKISPNYIERKLLPGALIEVSAVKKIG